MLLRLADFNSGVQAGSAKIIGSKGEEQSGNVIGNGTATFTEAFSNIAPSPDPFGDPTARSTAINLSADYLADLYALWGPYPPACEPANDSDSYQQHWSAKVGTVVYSLTTVISISRSTSNQGIPSFSSSISTP